MTQTLGWRNLRSVILILNITLLAGCSQRISSVNETLKEAFWGIDDVELSAQQISELPFASTYVRLNDGPRVFMVLAYAEKNPETGQTQLKWISHDQAMIITEQGRIVKTLNLPQQNLAQRESHRKSWEEPSQWQTHFDWQKGSHYGYTADVSTTKLSSEKVTSELWQETLDHWLETVSFPELSDSFQNHYWVNKQGWVLKSVQYIGPDMDRIEMDILKPYVEVQQ
ncbi:YjbF family lipoprotein [Vibrio fluvialis]|uniref:YjbF family lipoprotein n=1 Tax=Vibrio fluvialis TaxID=676 RepID=UPI0013026306|nr:YjbF family lipoprotein [Vibrio fluvialis]EKO3910283.1 YjbF family lipoprotein [Vibrio fluvialis]ELE2167334.1 YjbF family lipoprotein [Vibrio fluvialis]ELH4237007.1 YjbF family lipoprotein [Vibrio fluvialis]ELS3716467.1 YjbF family lipoprotein [Vibrio fluvialis]ELX9693164.1 YjbF family lipoprotein [Vibrio fluvialis]